MEIREATPEDAAGISRVRIDTWRIAYHGLIAPEVLDGLDLAAETARRRPLLEGRPPGTARTDLVAAEDGEVIGWAATGPADDDETVGELRALYVLPGHWGTGAGHALLVASEAALVEAGLARAVLWHLDGNERAARFYERHGWALDGGEKQDDRLVGGVQAWTLHELRRSKTLSA